MTDIKIFNGTPHAINIVEKAIFNPAIRKYVGGTVVLSIPPSGTMLNANITTTVVEPNTLPIPLFNKVIMGCDDIRDYTLLYDVIIVSALYASAVKATGEDTSKVYTVADPVFDEDGKTIVGCRGLAMLF